MSLSRRRFFAFTAGAGAIAAAQEAPHPKAPGPGTQWDPRMGVADADKVFQYSDRRPRVSLVKGDNRRKNVFNALVGIDDQIQPGLKRKKYVLVKVNGLAPGRNIGSTNLDCVHGILDYLASRFKGPVVITEGGEATYKQAFEEFGWNTVAPEHKPMDIGFALLNDNQRYELMTGIDYDLHLVPIRLYARLLDPDAFLISSSVMKTHNMVVATLTIKNEVGGAKIADVKRKYGLHADVDRMLEWRGPMLDLPPNLGRNRPRREEDLSAYA